MKLTARLRRLVLMLPVLWTAESVRAEDGIPALLEFAEQYSSKHIKEQASQISHKAANGLAQAMPSESPALRHALKQRDAQIARQQATLNKQESALAAEIARRLQAEQNLNNLKKVPLSQLFNGLRNVFTGVSDENRASALIAQLQERVRHERASLQQAQDQISILNKQIILLKRQQSDDETKTNDGQRPMAEKLEALQLVLDEKSSDLLHQQQKLAAEQEQHKALKVELKSLQAEQKTLRSTHALRLEKEKAEFTDQLALKDQELKKFEKRAKDLQVIAEQKDASLSALKQDREKLKVQSDLLTKQMSEREAELTRETQNLKQMKSEMDELRRRAVWLAKPQMLNHPSQQQAYAAGDALGRDILTLLKERETWGLKPDHKTILAGVVDAFSGEPQLPRDVLIQALADSEQAVNVAREKMIATQQKSGETFIADFIKQQGVKKSSSGFWYRVDYAGDTPLHETAIVDVVVKETLTDGTVIQDMSLTGNVLSQPLSAYPPLFREAIGHLKNHGSLTMVVPAELAYGEKGYAPNVPPNATMVYELRIDNSKAAPAPPGL
ncbi:FKBP-type peptidyl-prolyl cis-trans isomerase N-terminal domain-containing protein [Erwinia aphidicola]|jgi:FKBP-type peptidyl-prolyl cis-trans isomerase/chromosome segregation ATPase|uniref:FKBP-type peptidyl-prolyl cis-trans isomerase N-terminal domain-containing protein n=1 Tax=Erwinia aphidicola TaxID=68334 RepID=UPI00300D605C